MGPCSKSELTCCVVLGAGILALLVGVGVLIGLAL